MVEDVTINNYRENDGERKHVVCKLENQIQKPTYELRSEKKKKNINYVLTEAHL